MRVNARNGLRRWPSSAVPGGEPSDVAATEWRIAERPRFSDEIGAASKEPGGAGLSRVLIGGHPAMEGREVAMLGNEPELLVQIEARAELFPSFFLAKGTSR